MSSAEPGLVLQVWKVSSVLVCGATREASAQGSQACLSLHPLPWPRASESWKEPWEGKVLLGRG